MANQGDVRKSDRFFKREMPAEEGQRVNKELDKMSYDATENMYSKLFYDKLGYGNPEDLRSAVIANKVARDRRDRFNSNQRPHQYAQGGIASLQPQQNRYAGIDMRPFAKAGRAGDNVVGVSPALPGGGVHLNPQEVGVIKALAQRTGGLSRNPYTGLPEAFKLRDVLGFLAPVAINAAIPSLANFAGGEGIMGTIGDAAKWMGTSSMGPMATGLLSGAATGLISGNMMSGIGGGLMGAGIQQLAGPWMADKLGPQATGEQTFSWPDSEFAAAGSQTVPETKSMKDLIEYGSNKPGEEYKSSKYALPMVLGGGALMAMAKAAQGQQRGGMPTGPVGPQYKWNMNPAVFERGVNPYGRDIRRYGRPGSGGEHLFLPGGGTWGGFNQGGIVSLMGGGGITVGPGSGTGDQIPAFIQPQAPMQQPQAAALSPGEFVVPADVVSGLGNGSTEAGSDALQGMLARVRAARTGMTQQPRDINLSKTMPA